MSESRPLVASGQARRRTRGKCQTMDEKAGVRALFDPGAITTSLQHALPGIETSAASSIC
jgi:hypothetical protein